MQFKKIYNQMTQKFRKSPNYVSTLFYNYKNYSTFPRIFGDETDRLAFSIDLLAK